MSLPPRKRNFNFTPTKNNNNKQNLTPLQTLLQMGFAKNRAEKALAATGNRDVQLAADWLLAHVNDNFLDECIPREYILYLCPTGPFLEQLQTFWEKSNKVCGFNGAHSINIPHITLVSFFKAHDEYAPQLSKALQTILDGPGNDMLNKPMKMELYTSSNFMGFFVSEEDANYLKRLALQYVKEISHSTISLETQPHVKSLHLTLAYQFPQNKYDELLTMVEELDPTCASGWELRLYSRDPRLATKQVFKVTYPHTPREPDELELRIGDLIFINTDCIQNSTDGWVDGISWLTGNSGYLPENYTQRTAESDAWTLHQTVVLSDPLSPVPDSNTVSIGEDFVDGSEISLRNASNEQLLLSTTSTASDQDRNNMVNQMTEPQKILILRHGERIDFTFGSQWYTQCFESGKYVQKDLNMPKTLPDRKESAWIKDAPLTTIGLHQAKLVGASLKDHGITFQHVFSSPSYRCVQTTHEVLKAMGIDSTVKINIEPGIFEWLAWYQDELPDWCSDEELSKHFNINTNYEAVFGMEHLEAHFQENLEEFYHRNSTSLQEALKYIEGNVLVVGHATTLDTCTRNLIGKVPRNLSEMSRLMQKIPYLSAAAIERVDDTDVFRLVEPPCLTLTHTTNQKFNWKILDN